MRRVLDCAFSVTDIRDGGTGVIHDVNTVTPTHRSQNSITAAEAPAPETDMPPRLLEDLPRGSERDDGL